MNANLNKNLEISDSNPTPLLCALMENVSFEIIEILVIHGADVNQKDCNFDTPLHYALLFIKKISKLRNVISMLKHFGADLNARDLNEFSPLELAEELDYPDVIKNLLPHNKRKYDDSGVSPSGKRSRGGGKYKKKIRCVSRRKKHSHRAKKSRAKFTRRKSRSRIYCRRKSTSKFKHLK